MRTPSQRLCTADNLLRMLDVLAQEPPAADNPILSAPNAYVTPHIAWAGAAARGRIISIMADNLEAFLAGTPQNVVS